MVSSDTRSPNGNSHKNGILTFFSWTLRYVEGTILDVNAWNFVRLFSKVQSTNRPKEIFVSFSRVALLCATPKIRPKTTYFRVHPLTLHISVQNFVVYLMWTRKGHNRVFSVIGSFGCIWQPQGPIIEKWAQIARFLKFSYKNVYPTSHHAHQPRVKIWYKNIVTEAQNRDFWFLRP